MISSSRTLLFGCLAFCFQCLEAQTSEFDIEVASINIDYPVGAYHLTEFHKSQLDTLYDSVTAQSKIELNGYADNQGDQSFNLQLSRNRNEQIKQYFVSKGVKPSLIIANSHGEKFISETETSETVKQKNRRVTVSVVNPVPLKEFKGILTSEDSTTTIQGKIAVYVDGAKTEFSVKEDGIFELQLPIGKAIQINYSSKEHFSQLDKVTLSSKSETSDVLIALRKMMMHETENTNLEFIRGKSILVDDSEPQLDAIYDMLMDNASICIEIGGHVFARKTIVLSRDSEKFQLSIARSLEVYNYLFNRGIEQTRMFARGYGNSQLLNPNAQTREEASANRRVEIKIVDCVKAAKIKNPTLHNLESFRTLEDFPMGRNYNPESIQTDLVAEGPQIIEQINDQADKLRKLNQDPTKFTYAQLFGMYRNQKLKHFKEENLEKTRR